MILTMDIGNTNVKYGVFDGDNLIASWRVSTMASRTADEYGMVLYDLLTQSGVRFGDIDACVMSSVAPALNYTIDHMCRDYIGKEPLRLLRQGRKYLLQLAADALPRSRAGICRGA